MKFLVRGVVLVVLLSVLSPLVAQEKPGIPDQAIVDAMNADADLRATLAEELAASKESPGREFQPAFRATLLDRLKKHSVEQLRAELRAGIIAPDAVGDTRADLTYTPLSAPCRIIDTRVAGGALSGGAPGPARSFEVAGTANFDLQGGTAGGCGIPVGATSVLINFVAVNPQGIGNLRGSAYPTAIPTTGSIVNYQQLTPTLNVANGLLFPICDPSVNSCVEDITLVANGAGTDVVADVLGYAMRFPKEQVRSFTVTSSTAASTQFTASCTNYAGGTITVNAPVAGNVHVQANMMIFWNHTAGIATIPDAYIGTTNTDCGGTFGLNAAYVDGASLPTGVYQFELHMDRVVAVPAGSSTFYLNGRLSSGSDLVYMNWGGMVATFEPN